MTYPPQVSVIIPVRNSAAYLAAAIGSVLTQTFDNLELLVIDDGSTDSSAAVVAAITDRRAKYVHQTRQGASAARNRGVAESTAPYLAFLDADDLWLPEKLSHQMHMLAQPGGPDMGFGHFTEFISPNIAPDPAADGPAQPGYSSCTMLVRRAAFMAAGEFDPAWRLGEFIEWYARAIDAGLSSRMLPDVVLRRRIHAANSTRQSANDRREYARVASAILRRRRTTGQEVGAADAKRSTNQP